MSGWRKLPGLFREHELGALVAGDVFCDWNAEPAAGDLWELWYRPTARTTHGPMLPLLSGAAPPGKSKAPRGKSSEAPGKSVLLPGERIDFPKTTRKWR